MGGRGGRGGVLGCGGDGGGDGGRLRQQPSHVLPQLRLTIILSRLVQKVVTKLTQGIVLPSASSHTCEHEDGGGIAGGALGRGDGGGGGGGVHAAGGILSGWMPPAGHMRGPGSNRVLQSGSTSQQWSSPRAHALERHIKGASVGQRARPPWQLQQAPLPIW